jgi:hypothetical protein
VRGVGRDGYLNSAGGQSLKLDLNIAELVHWTLLENRYLHVRPDEKELGRT